MHRPPADQSDWPPSIIVDFFYGCTVVKMWGSDDCRNVCHKFVKDKYYKQEPPHLESAKRARIEQAKRHAARGFEDADDPATGFGSQGVQTSGREEEKEEMMMGDIMDLLMFFRSRCRGLILTSHKK
jgi:hypothetical protein